MKNENQKSGSGKGGKKDAERVLPVAKAMASSGTDSPVKKQGASAGIFPSIKLSERDRQAGFALLVVAAISLVAYVLFFTPPVDKPSDMDTFVGRVLGSNNVSLFLDARGASQESSRIVFQCGVDIAGGSLFGSKTVATYACDNDGCISANSASNGSNTLTYETVQKKLAGMPYVLVRSGVPSTLFFENHAEITIDESFNASCKLG